MNNGDRALWQYEQLSMLRVIMIDYIVVGHYGHYRRTKGTLKGYKKVEMEKNKKNA